MRITVDRGKFAPWVFDVETVDDVDRELTTQRQALVLTYQRWYPGRPYRQAKLAEAIEKLLAARTELAEAETLAGVDLDGPLPDLAQSEGSA